MASTALMPVDPAAAPQQTNRLLSIRADLLPPEIRFGRNARRMRSGVIVGLVVVLALMGAWYGYALHGKTLADDELAGATAQVNDVRTDAGKFSGVTTVKAQNEAVVSQLKALLADDLPWSTVLDDLRSTAAASNVTITSIGATVADKQNAAGTALPSDKSTTTVYSLTIGGTAKDKKTIAQYIDALGNVVNIANPYLTTATQTTTGVTFMANADVTSTALCGRWTKTCPSGGN